MRTLQITDELLEAAQARAVLGAQENGRLMAAVANAVLDTVKAEQAASAQPAQPEAPASCSFCSRSRSEIKKLVAGPGMRAFICDGCVANAAESIATDGYKAKAEPAQPSEPADFEELKMRFEHLREKHTRDQERIVELELQLRSAENQRLRLARRFDERMRMLDESTRDAESMRAKLGRHHRELRELAEVVQHGQSESNPGATVLHDAAEMIRWLRSELERVSKELSAEQDLLTAINFESKEDEEKLARRTELLAEGSNAGREDWRLEELFDWIKRVRAELATDQPAEAQTKEGA